MPALGNPTGASAGWTERGRLLGVEAASAAEADRVNRVVLLAVRAAGVAGWTEPLATLDEMAVERPALAELLALARAAAAGATLCFFALRVLWWRSPGLSSAVSELRCLRFLLASAGVPEVSAPSCSSACLSPSSLFVAATGSSGSGSGTGKMLLAYWSRRSGLISLSSVSSSKHRSVSISLPGYIASRFSIVVAWSMNKAQPNNFQTLSSSMTSAMRPEKADSR